MTAARRGTAATGRPADTGFLLAPLLALVFTGAILLATVLAPIIPMPQSCQLGELFTQRCNGFFSNWVIFYDLIVLPGAATFLWQAELRRRRTRPLDPAMFPAAAQVIDAVFAGAALRKPVPVRVGPRMGRRAHTGGWSSRAYIAMGPELLALAGKSDEDRRVFEAVLRHELAHVQNKDLLRAQTATLLRVSMWVIVLGTLLFAIAPHWYARPLGAAAVVRVVLLTVFLVIVAEVTVRAFLRTREHEADLRASGGDPASVRAALHGGVERDRAWLDRLLSRHPSVGQRRAGIDEPTDVLRFPLGQVLAGGLFTGVGLVSVQAFLSFLQVNVVLGMQRSRDDVPWIELLTVAGAVGLPAAVFLTVGVWRAAWRGLLTGRRPRLWLIALVYAAGLLLGTRIEPYGQPLGMSRAGGPPINLATLIVFGGALVALFAWLAAMARPFLPATATPGGRTRMPWFLLPVTLPVAAGVVVFVWQVGRAASALEFQCSYLTCGILESQWRTLQAAVQVLYYPWAATLLILAVLGLLASTVRATQLGQGATAGPNIRRELRRAGIVVAVASATELLWMYLPGGGALAPDLSFISGDFHFFRTAIAVLTVLLTALALVVVVRPPLAGPIAATGALIVAIVGLSAMLVELNQLFGAFPADLARAEVGTMLGEAQLIAQVVIVAALGVRMLIARRPAPARSDAAPNQTDGDEQKGPDPARR